MPIAALDRVSVRRGGRAILDGASLSVEPGERVALLGGNGAGKTTLLRLLAGFDVPDEGAVHAPSGGGAIGFVPQAVAEHLFAWFSVLRNVAMPLLVARRPDALGAARAVCERVLPGLDVNRRAGALSGGEKQLVSIARALAAPGALVLADEPFAALSSPARRRLHEVFPVELRGRALILVTHDPNDVAALCGRAVRLEDGRPVPFPIGA